MTSHFWRNMKFDLSLIQKVDRHRPKRNLLNKFQCRAQIPNFIKIHWTVLYVKRVGGETHIQRKNDTHYTTLQKSDIPIMHPYKLWSTYYAICNKNDPLYVFIQNMTYPLCVCTKMTTHYAFKKWSIQYDLLLITYSYKKWPDHCAFEQKITLHAFVHTFYGFKQKSTYS